MAAIVTFKFIDLDGSIIKEGHTLGGPSTTDYNVVFNNNTIEFWENGDTILPQNIISFSGEGITGYLWDGTYHPVGTSYEFSDYLGLSSTITAVKYVADLTNTTWYVPSGWSHSFSDTTFDIRGEATVYATTTYSFMFLLLRTYIHDEDPTLYFEDYGATDGYHIKDAELIQGMNITITGGTDVTNADLISWLQTYGKQLKVTDLTNTTWVLNETVKGFSDTSFDISGSFYCIYSNSDDIAARAIDNFTILDGTYGWCLSLTNNYAKNPSYHTYGGTSWYTRYYTTGTTYYEYVPTVAEDILKLRTVTITGGADATNPKLIAWLSEYGKQIPTDLTGYTVTVPAGWQCDAGQGQYNIIGTVKTGSDNSNTSITAMWLGYDGNEPYYDNTIQFRNNNSNIHMLGTNIIGFSVSITGGDDATNTSLIQWLVDNNATFEKTGGEETQTLTIINANNESETVTFTTNQGDTFSVFAGNEDFGFIDDGGDYEIVHYKGYALTYADGTPARENEIASGTFYYEGEALPTERGEIWYKGILLAILTEGQTVILHTEGFKAAEDIVVKNTVGARPISFTIDNTTYYAEEGMTWAEWVESNYNTGGFSFDGAWTEWVYKGNSEYVCDQATSLPAVNIDIILANNLYITMRKAHNGDSNN